MPTWLLVANYIATGTVSLAQDKSLKCQNKVLHIDYILIYILIYRYNYTGVAIRDWMCHYEEGVLVTVLHLWLIGTL